MIPERVAWAVEQMSIRAGDRVLEIGCGPGHAVSLLSAKVGGGSVTAIDRSALQVKKARALNRAAIAAGRVRVEQLALTRAPAAFGEHAFEKVLAINVNAFWTAPGPSCTSLARLLGRNGRAYLIYEPPSDTSAKKLRAALPRFLEAHGLAKIEIVKARFTASVGLCFGAERRGAFESD